MTFDELLALVSSPDAPGLCVDSRLVKAGDIFVAVKGTVYDGHDFINQAVANGTKYIVCQKRYTQYAIRNTQYEIIVVENSAKAAAILAQASNGSPASQLTNLAVTGTNGKTTVAYLVRSVIENAGQNCGLISTIVYDTGAESCQATLTTPDCITIAEKQRQMLTAGAKYMVIEASSHALLQNRLAAINFKAAAFTNLAGDHLDYHKTEKNYLAAKAALFQTLSPDAVAVLNKQSPEAMQIAQKTNAKVLWYAVDEYESSIEHRASSIEICAHIESMDINGTRFSILDTRYSSSIEVKSPLLGRYNVSNHLAAAGLCLAAGFDLQTTASGLSALKNIPGRLEKIDWDGDFSVLIDYAHTDDALKNVLATLKPLCGGNLIVVFGCGGDRDRTKRPRMAKVAESAEGGADFVIVTSDNPRTERPVDIIDEIVAGFENGSAIPYAELRDTSDERRATKIIEPDRKKAIELAIKTAGKDDIVLIAGKGHETYQIIGTQKFDFNDKKVAEEYLKKRITNSC
jgi:UDP-N-acetylmuramoyl-L-alanyl-D-glutamate--2,6-diaminopimelate ligase